MNLCKAETVGSGDGGSGAPSHRSVRATAYWHDRDTIARNRYTSYGADLEYYAGEVFDMPRKATSLRVAKKASKLLRDGRTGRNTKSVAASALSQREKRKS